MKRYVILEFDNCTTMVKVEELYKLDVREVTINGSKGFNIVLSRNTSNNYIISDSTCKNNKGLSYITHHEVCKGITEAIFSESRYEKSNINVVNFDNIIEGIITRKVTESYNQEI